VIVPIFRHVDRRRPSAADAARAFSDVRQRLANTHPLLNVDDQLQLNLDTIQKNGERLTLADPTRNNFAARPSNAPCHRLFGVGCARSTVPPNDP
jgi:hypothetical protein